MTETAKVVIDRLQGEAGYATGGEVDRLVFSGLDVHTMLNEIEQAIDTGKLSVEKLQEQLNTAKKLLTELAYGECHTCGEEFEDNNCEFCSFAYPFCSQECYDNYMKNEGSGDE